MCQTLARTPRAIRFSSHPTWQWDSRSHSTWKTSRRRRRHHHLYRPSSRGLTARWEQTVKSTVSCEGVDSDYPTSLVVQMLQWIAANHWFPSMSNVLHDDYYLHVPVCWKIWTACPCYGSNFLNDHVHWCDSNFLIVRWSVCLCYD